MRGTGASPDLVPYALFQDSARTMAWGNLAGTNTVAGIGSGNAVTVSVHGRVLSAAFTPDTYLDTVTVTVVY
jgi:spore coat protein U-like protein